MRIALATLAASLMFGAASAQQTPAPPPPMVDWAKIEIKATDLGNNTYMLTGQGGNITIAVGSDAIIMVDGQFAPLSDKIKAAIKAISALPVKFLINTHYHGDHTGGNENFAKDGAVIVAHDNIRVRLAAGTIQGLTGNKVAPRPAEALPKETYFGGSMTVEAGGRKAQLTHISNAHTDGDSWIYFADANVLSTGDTFNNLKRYQNIDFANGGDVRGMIRALDTYIKASNDGTKIVPGHGPLASKADLAIFRDMLVTSRDRIEKLFNEGKSEQEVIDAKPLADLDATWANNPGHAVGHTRNVYNSFKRLGEGLPSVGRNSANCAVSPGCPDRAIRSYARAATLGGATLRLRATSAAPNASNSLRFTGFFCGSYSACHCTPSAKPAASAMRMASIVPSSATPSTTIRWPGS
jgi:cyclase